MNVDRGETWNPQSITSSYKRSTVDSDYDYNKSSKRGLG